MPGPFCGRLRPFSCRGLVAGRVIPRPLFLSVATRFAPILLVRVPSSCLRPGLSLFRLSQRGYRDNGQLALFPLRWRVEAEQSLADKTADHQGTFSSWAEMNPVSAIASGAPIR